MMKILRRDHSKEALMRPQSWFPTILCLMAVATATVTSADDSVAVVKIQTSPDRLVLSSLRDARSVLVYGQTADGKIIDLSDSAKRTAGGPQITVDKEGYVTPVAVGATELIVSAGGQTVKVPVEVKEVSATPTDFIRDVEPIMAKVGCNMGTCHGAQQGRKGFKLSLRGYDPIYDYRALVDDVSGRRFNRTNPSDSLMLLKPTQGVPHEGGFLFDEESRAYKIIHQWIAEGCNFSEATRPTSLDILPKNPILDRSGSKQQMQVIASFADGTSRDVTRDSIFESSNFEVATVGGTGQVKAVRRGETSILVRYEGAYASNTVLVLGTREGFAWKDSPEFNFIDTHVNNKLKRLKIQPADLCSDAEFLRRVTLDLTGLPANGEQTKAFLNDPRESQIKRKARIDELLESPDSQVHQRTRSLGVPQLDSRAGCYQPPLQRIRV
jgi:hypothetical protein